MNDGSILILFLLVALALLWFFVWGPQATEARAAREVQALPEESAVEEMLSNYAVMREQVKSAEC